MQFGQEKFLVQIHEHGHQPTIFPPDGLVTALRYGRDPDGATIIFHHLEVWMSPIVGISQLQFDNSFAGQDRAVPHEGLPGNHVALPESGAWGSWVFSPPNIGLTLSWPGKVTNPGFALGPELEGQGSKCPHNGGAGEIARKPGSAITAIQYTNDPDGTLGLRVFYRELL